jgi:hypothetical protein
MKPRHNIQDQPDRANYPERTAVTGVEALAPDFTQNPLLSLSNKMA